MRFILALFFVIVAASPLAAATRNYTVTDYSRIQIEGPFAVSVKNGGAPFARASGSQRALDRVSLRVEGRTLIIRLDRSAWGGMEHDADAGPVTIETGTHALSYAQVLGSGSVTIDRARGLEFALSSSGSGTASLADVAVDRLRVSADGPGAIRVAGQAKKLDASQNGPGSIDASALTVKDANLSAAGPASLRATVINSVKLHATGTATIAIEGGAACTKVVSGSAVVTGCR